MGWFTKRPRTTYTALFLFGFAVYALVSGERLARQSPDPHFVLQADAWLHGRLDIPEPWKGDDPAKVETVQLVDGSTVRGRYLHTRKRLSNSAQTTRIFRTTQHQDISEAMIAARLGHVNYVSFPPFPSVLMIPQVLVHGKIANDVFPTVLVAALILPLCFSTLRCLRKAGLSKRTDEENLWLTALLAFGTVFFFTAVQGRVWFTAHVVGVVLALAYLRLAIGARHPVLAGVALGLATLCRTPMAFMFPFFAFEVWRTHGGLRAWRQDWRPFVRPCLAFATPIVCIAIIAGVHNALRFESFTEFGHSYLAVRQQPMIEEYGLFDYEYLRRNLSVAFTLLPRFTTTAPYIHLSGHGMALWLTTPLFVSLLWPKTRGPIHTALWCTVACIALPILFYQNSGWVQFGYRFSLDYTVFLIALLAIGGRPLTRLSRGLIVFSIALNLFGAWTFGRYPQVYDAGSYDTIVSHHPS